MSGTSLDGVDAVLADFSSSRPLVLGHYSVPMPQLLRSDLLALNSTGDNELHRAALAANGLARLYAQAVHTLLYQCRKPVAAIRAIGAHGQTVRHRPREFDGTGYTLQLNQPALLAELCGIDVVADFRSRDIAAGGQGAPLVPPFHQAFFGNTETSTAVLNIGGISNISVLKHKAPEQVSGFDCGPGNALMDAWCKLHTGADFDSAGQWAAGGTIHPVLLLRMQQETFFHLPAPKSTGRDLFNMQWLQQHLDGLPPIAPQDVQATLTELTAWACSTSVILATPDCKQLIVCGGGAYNTHLLQRIALRLPECEVVTSDTHGLPPLQVEAAAFAWLAHKTVERKTASLPGVTGALGARILGAIYPA